MIRLSLVPISRKIKKIINNLSFLEPAVDCDSKTSVEQSTTLIAGDRFGQEGTILTGSLSATLGSITRRGGRCPFFLVNREQ